MVRYRFTDYFEKEVLRKRSYLKKEWCTRVLDSSGASPRATSNRRFQATRIELRAPEPERWASRTLVEALWVQAIP